MRHIEKAGAVLALLLFAGGPTLASNEAAGFEALAMALSGEKVPIEGVVLGASLGYGVASSVAAALEMGYGWGIKDTQLFGSTTFKHISLRPQIAWDFENDRGHGAGSLLAGYTVHDFLVGYGIAAGLEVNYDEQWRAGPTVVLRGGFPSLAVFAVGTIAFPNTRASLVVGLEFLLAPRPRAD